MRTFHILLAALDERCAVVESLTFPPDFVWGVSTSAFQIEGATREGGRGSSIWDTFTATDGKIARGERANIAADHYHRYPEDIALMAELGVGAYRMSVAWPRIQPTGKGTPNREGLDFYDRLLDQVCDAGTSPVFITGIPRSPSKTRAAGLRGRQLSASASTPRSSANVSPIG
jgi:hypothetical protein